MKVTIFYSWQSDLPNATNRAFIEQAIQKAIKAIKAEEDTILEPCLDRDTSGVPGTPDIASTIFRKIEDCQVFIGDVSIINPVTETGRKTPNPNVLIELAYAARGLTWDNVICVFNTAYGDMGDLPFDLRLRRMCIYTAAKGQEGKAEERNKLAAKLKDALVPILKQLAVKVQEDTTTKSLTPDAASAKVKEYLSDDSHRIPLSELLLAEGNELARKIVSPEFPAEMQPPPTVDMIRQRVQRFEDLSQVALSIIIAGCYYGREAHVKLWTNLLQRVANAPGERDGFVDLLKLRRYPALLLVYGGGIAAVAAENYETLLALFTKPTVPNDYQGTDGILLDLLTPNDVIGKDLANAVWGERRPLPVSEHFFRLLREPFRFLSHDDRQYQRYFDRFEYLRSLLEVGCSGCGRASRGAAASGTPFRWVGAEVGVPRRRGSLVTAGRRRPRRHAAPRRACSRPAVPGGTWRPGSRNARASPWRRCRSASRRPAWSGGS
jgi:hypothetical protein